MPELRTGQTSKHLALTHLLVYIFTAGYFFNCMQYASGARFSTCTNRCRCNITVNILVNCTDQAFKVIPDDIPPLTVDLIFNWNFITTLSSPSFAKTRFLELFSIANNRLQTIENGTFAGLFHLTHLILYGNSLLKVPHAILELTNITVLDLSRNQLTIIEGSSFSQSLLELYLCENLISSLDERSFLGLNNIEVINLSHNRVHIVSANSFLHNVNLKGLNIVHNTIKTLPKGWLGNSKNLVELYLTGNKITWTSDVREWFISQSTLDLEVLFLDKNIIRTLPVTAFHGIPRMKQLHLGNNQLQYISGASFDRLLNLEYLLLSNNLLKSVPPDLVTHNKRLTKLVLRGNELARLPESLLLNNLALELFDLAGNRLTNLPKELLGNAVYQNLTQLDLRNNRFRKVPDLQTIPSLMQLQMSNNKVAKLGHTVFDGNPYLVEIDMDGNELEGIDRKTFSGLENLEILSLGGNKFMCDCKIVWLIKTHSDWAVEAQKTIVCKYPYSANIPSLYDYKSAYDDPNLVDTVQDMLDLCNGPKEKGKYIMLACIWLLVVVLILVVYWSRKILKAQKRLNAGKPKIKRRYSLVPNKITRLEKPPWNSFRRHSQKRNGNYTYLSKSSPPPTITVSCLPHSGMVYKQRETTV